MNLRYAVTGRRSDDPQEVPESGRRAGISRGLCHSPVVEQIPAPSPGRPRPIPVLHGLPM
jgi:hypothetical protein